jgi:FeS assembly SUF system protein
MNEERKIETEEVEAVSPPPRARVPSDFERKKDYLAGFLAGEKEALAAGPGSDLQAAVVDVLKSIYDPEIPVDIYELGLIYRLDVDPERNIEVDMTLTAPGCPVAGDMPGWVENAVSSVPGVGQVKVNLVFDPPWDPSRMSEEARLALNMF